MTEHTGGPESPEKLAERHGRYVRSSDPAVGPQFKIVDLSTGDPVGWVGYWSRQWRNEEVYEIGWSVIPSAQGRGFASAATMLAIDVARTHGTRRFLHAFPSADNPPSNAVCRKTGFTLVEEVEFEHPPGVWMRSNDWRIDLRP